MACNGRCTVRFQGWHSFEKPAGIGMRGIAKNLISRTDLNQVSRVHDRNSIGDIRNHRQIVRDEKHGEAEFVAQAGEQVENLRLDP